MPKSIALTRRRLDAIVAALRISLQLAPAMRHGEHKQQFRRDAYEALEWAKERVQRRERSSRQGHGRRAARRAVEAASNEQTDIEEAIAAATHAQTD